MAIAMIIAIINNSNSYDNSFIDNSNSYTNSY